MWRFVYTITMVAGFTASASAGAPDYFPEKSKDFATTSIGPVLVHYFPITNTTKDTLKLGTPRIGCGCVAASLLKAQLEPGETTHVVAYMDTKKIPTHQRNTFKTVTVTVPFLNPVPEEVVLKVSCVAREDLFFSPDSLAFGSVQKSAGGKVSMKVTLFNQPKWEIKDAKSNGKFVKVETKSANKGNGEISYEVIATLDPDCPKGNWMSEVFLTTNGVGVEKIRIPVTVTVTESIAVSPSEVSFGDVNSSKTPSTQQVTLTGDAPFKILEVKVPNGSVSVTQVTEGSRAAHVLKVNMAAETEGKVKQTIEIVTDSKTQPKLIVNVSALVLVKK